MSRSRPTTPIRRVSRGSITALSNSQSQGYGGGGSNKEAGTTPLSCFSSAMGDLADEMALLQANLEYIDGIQDSLQTFDESFAMFLYGLKMNAFCVEWPERPDEDSFARVKERQAALSGLAPASSRAPRVSMDAVSVLGPDDGIGDQTYMTQDDDLLDRRPTTTTTAALARTSAPSKASTSSQQQHQQQPLKSALKKPSTGAASASKAGASSAPASAPKGRITVAQKKKREAYAAQIIDTLPLEYRGNDPKTRALAQHVIMALIAASSKGIRIADIVKAPDFPQAKINKTLIALVSAKHVQKRSDNGIVYYLDESRHGTLP
ncbi:hypothetical protein FA10DRAFT_99788 [Acaromyces ingoldii]|uniref:DASH complex subunit DAM1 n=1 Tax=Acaromyces ingoldii TaxID=215250 RepID=A0A316YPB1_9BASI|nr:hypothetical protein FA10DRAFT_99788 [Acaromyces ingoldii]PWN89893.1 hypothetical protein FA10DRAFT_99788 [Acaromyces ingoldii]